MQATGGQPVAIYAPVQPVYVLEPPPPPVGFGVGIRVR